MKFFGDPLPVEIRHPEMLGEHTPQTSATDERFGLAIVTELIVDTAGTLSTPWFQKGSGFEPFVHAVTAKVNKYEGWEIRQTEATISFHSGAVAPFLSLFQDVILLGPAVMSERFLAARIARFSSVGTRVRIPFPANGLEGFPWPEPPLVGYYMDATTIADPAAEERVHDALALVYAGHGPMSEEARHLALTLPHAGWATHFQDCKRQIWPRVFVTDPEAVKQAMTSAMDARAQVWFVDSENPFVPALTARDSALLQILRSHAAKRDRVSDFRLCIQPGGFLYSGPTTAIPG